MPLSKEIKIGILEIHKSNLLNTKTFEEYRDAHCAYIDMLIKEIKGELVSETAITDYVEWKPKND